MRARKYEPGLRYRRYELVDVFVPSLAFAHSSEPPVVREEVQYVQAGRSGKMPGFVRVGLYHRAGWLDGLAPENVRREAAAQANARDDVKTYEEFCEQFREAIEIAEAKAIIEQGL